MAAKKAIKTKAIQTLKNNVTAKKAVTKKGSLKKAVIKKASDNSLTEKISIAPKKSLKKEDTKTGRRQSSKDRPMESSEVELPSNMSQRSIEKVAVFEHHIINHFEAAASKIAYVSGVCLTLVGLTYASPYILSDLAGVHFPAQLISSNTQTESVAPVGDSVFQLTTNIPDEVLSPYPVTFSLTNAKTVKVKMLRRGELGFYDIDSEQLSSDRYRFTVPADNLAPGYYLIRIYVVPASSNYMKAFESKEFYVGPPIADLKDKDPASASNDDDSSTNGDEDLPEEADIVEISATRPAFAPQSADSLKKFTIFINKTGFLSGTEVIGISTPEEYRYVELYARPVQSMGERFVALASKRFGQWQFVVNTLDIPNGQYEFYAKTKSSNQELKTDSIPVTVKNAAVAQTNTNPPRPAFTTNIGSNSSTSLAAESVEEANERLFLDPDLAEFVPTKTLEEGVNNEVNAILEENSSRLSDLIERYAVAVQTGDEILVKAARDNIANEKDRLVTMALSNERTRDIGDDVDEALQSRLQDLQNRVDTFEQIRSERSGGASALDTDGDGVSDFDEINLYESNPEAVDTDNDGVTDGIEIMRGFNPNDAAAEAVIEFESPKDSIGLVRSDVLVVEDIIPTVKVNDSGGTLVAAEIKGKSLPNSFVTLYIFSSPTVVTIKTDADGSFVYTFDRELADGEHDVYAAVTDNTGEIIAQSKPFSFVKTAEAFTPVDAANAEVTSSTGGAPDVTKNNYKTVAGMGILALGLILVMLGASLRPKIVIGVDAVENDDKGFPPVPIKDKNKAETE